MAKFLNNTGLARLVALIKQALGGKADKTELPLVVTFTDVDDNISCDTSIADIYAAYSSGRHVVGHRNGNEQWELTSSGPNSALFSALITSMQSMLVGNNDGSVDTWLSVITYYQEALTFDSAPTAGSGNPVTSGGVKTALDGKQATLVSGTNIKTVCGSSILGSGDLQLVADDIYTGYGSVEDALNAKQDTLVSGTNIKTVNNNSLLGSGNVDLGGGDILYLGKGKYVLENAVDSSIDNALDDLDNAIHELGTPNEIARITATESQTSGGNNVVTITETNGTTTTFNVKNGIDGQDGQDGADGVSLGEIALVQTTGDSEESVMSQKSVTEYGRKVTAEDLAGTSEWIRTKLTEEGWEFGKYIKTNGNLANNANCCVSPFLPVSMSEHKGHKIILQYMYYIYSSWCACYYDSNKAYISGFYYQGVETNTRTVTVGTSDSWDNVAYVRYTFGSSKLSECFIYDDNIGEYLFKGDEYISEICNSLNLTVGSLEQTKGESVSTTMSQKSISDAIKYNADIQFGKCITITDSWNYFKITPKATSLLNASEKMTFMFSTKGTGALEDYRYFGFGNGNITSANGMDTNGAGIYWSYTRNCSANYVSYTLNKTSDNKYPAPDVWLVTWDRVNGIVKFYDRTKLINTLEGNSYKKDYFVNDSGAMVIKGGDNTVRVYDVRLFDYDITTLFGNGTFIDEIVRLEGAGTPSSYFQNNYTNARYDGSFIAHTNTYGSGTGWTITNNGSTRIYKNSTTTTLLSAGYYVGSDTKARIWKTNIEVVSGVVTFNKGNANWGSIHVYNSNNEEVDRTNVGVGTYTLIGENCSVACWNVFRVSGDVELIETERSYKLMSCVLHMKCDKLYNNKLYDDQTKTFFNFYSDRNFNTIKTSNTLSDVPQRMVRTGISTPPYYTGEMAVVGNNVYVGLANYTWKQINNS